MALPLPLIAALMPSSSTASFSNGANVSIPFNNRTALNSEIVTAWVSSADRRGTGDILYSCTITITLCIFTVLHLNVPARGEKAWKQYSRKVRWMFTALLAPEIVLYVAFTQYSQARKLCKLLNDPVSQRTKNHELEEGLGASNKRPQVSLSYGFFAVMGGFEADVSKFCDTADQITLDIDLITALARNGQYLPVRKAEIQDKSKANALGKGLVCLQIAWMLVQCSARKAAGYPLTLLELHTFVHVVCAVALYAFWLKKPLDVTEPSVVDLRQEDYDSIALDMVRCDRRAFVLAGRDNSAPGLVMNWSQPYDSRQSYDPHPDQIAPTDIEIILQEVPRSQAYEDQYQVMERCEFGFFYARLSPKLAEYIGVSDVDRKAIYKARLDLTEKCVLRHQMAQRAVTNAPASQVSGEAIGLDGMRELRTRSSNAANLISKLSLKYLTSFWKPSSWKFSLALVVLTAINGSLHLTAWKFEFATPAERWLWRGSCVYIAVFALPVLALAFLIELGTTFRERITPSYHNRDRACTCRTCKLLGYLVIPLLGLICVLYLLEVILLGIGLPAYVFARIFLVIESFFSLRHVPVGVYAAVPWSNYIPHF